MKKLSKILGVVLCLVMVMALLPLGASAATTTIVAADLGLANSTAIVDLAVDTVVTLDGDKGTHSNSKPAYFNAGTNIRIYTGNTFTISVTSAYKITSIAFTCTSSYGFNDYTFSSGELDGTNLTVSGDVNSVTLTNNSSTQIRLTQIAVTYAAAGTPECQHTSTSVKSNETQHWYVCDNADCGKQVGEKTDHNPNGITAKCSTCNFQYTPCANVKAAVDTAKDSFIKVTGIVTVNIGDGNVYIQDSTGAIDVYFASKDDAKNLKPGDEITVVGKRGEYNKLQQVAGAKLVSSSKKTPIVAKVATVATCKDGSIAQSTLVELKNVTVVVEVSGKNTNYWLKDSNDNKIQIYKPYFPEGFGDKSVVTVTGVLSCYNSNPQLRVGEDYGIIVNTPTVATEVTAKQALDKKNGALLEIKDLKVNLISYSSSGDHATVYVQDSTSGFALYVTKEIADTLKVGDTITAKGIKDVYNGLHQLNKPTLVGEPQNGTPNTPANKTISEITTDDMGKLVKISGATVIGVTKDDRPTITLSDGTNKIKIATGYNVAGLGNKAIVDVVAVVDVTTSGARLKVAAAEDIKIVTPAPTAGTKDPDDAGDSTAFVGMAAVMVLSVTAMAALVVGKKKYF